MIIKRAMLQINGSLISICSNYKNVELLHIFMICAFMALNKHFSTAHHCSKSVFPCQAGYLSTGFVANCSMQFRTIINQLTFSFSRCDVELYHIPRFHPTYIIAFVTSHFTSIGAKVLYFEWIEDKGRIVPSR